jgi:hypothetical protein
VILVQHDLEPISQLVFFKGNRCRHISIPPYTGRRRSRNDYSSTEARST